MSEKFVYQEIECKTALNPIHSHFLPYHYDLNCYRGCEHQCIYCFAQYSHRYLDDQDFFHHIYVKKNIVEQLEKKLKSKTWKKEVVNLGGVTDSYQIAEKEYQLMPQILKLLIQYRTPAIISTKSSLILRDLSLLKELSLVAGVQIAVTITTLDQELANFLEPNASPIKERLEVIRILKEAGLTVGWHLMPMIPYLTATKSNLEAIFKEAERFHIDYMIMSNLNLRGPTRNYFFQRLKQKNPQWEQKMRKLYQDKEAYATYKKELSTYLQFLCETYHIPEKNQPKMPKKGVELEQLSLFRS